MDLGRIEKVWEVEEDPVEPPLVVPDEIPAPEPETIEPPTEAVPAGVGNE